jgi:ferredoxin
MEEPAILDRGGLERLLRLLREDGWTPIGPTLRDGAIVYDEIAGVADLPAGVGDAQRPGQYRLVERDDRALFGFAAPLTSWKQFLQPPRELLYRVHRDGERPCFAAEPPAPPRLALVGARACELAAIAVQDRVLGAADPGYAARRASLLVVAVHCTTPAATCFCASLGTGPRASGGFDLALTELVSGAQSSFLVESGSARGEALRARLPLAPASVAQREAAAAAVERAACQARRVDPVGLPAALQASLDHPRWDDVARRCLACGNCTLVCPTCFCTTVESRSALATDAPVEHWRRWDSCFSPGFSYIHGGSVRSSVRARYRQWLTHKLGSWVAQFGTLGCVGCGRCLTWCPASIDLTAEVAALRGEPTAAYPAEPA